MGVFRRGIIALALVAGAGVAATSVTAEGIRTRSAGPGYIDRPSIWRGLYGGIHLGHVDADFDDGFVGGVQLGYNWQSNQIVYGLEGDLSLSGADSIDYLASLRGRLGYLIQPSLLIYATAGLGMVDSGGNSDSDVGFVYGLGVEGIISDTMSARLEYLAFNNDNGQGDDVSVIRAGLNIKLGR